MSLCGHQVAAQNDSTLQQPHELQRVEVVASRYGMETRASVPVQRIDRERMLRLGIHSMTDALNHMAGLTVRDYGGAGGMKTVSVRGIGARHTAVVYDGIALTDCQTGEIDLSRYSLDHLYSVQLVVGDGDNIFQPARNQMGAATLYLETQQPTRTHSANEWILDTILTCGAEAAKPSVHRQEGKAKRTGAGAFSIGSFGLVNPSFRISERLTPDIRISAIGEYFHADNDYPFTLHNQTLTTRERRTNSHMNSVHGEFDLDWQIDARNDLAAKAYYYNNHRRLPGIVHYYTNENHERLAEQTAFGQLKWLSELSNAWSLMVHAKYNWAHTDYENRTAGSGIGDAQYWQREAFGSASVLFKPVKWLSFDYSLDVLYNALHSHPSANDQHPSRQTLLQMVAAKAQWPRLTLVGRMLMTLAKDQRATSTSADADHRTSSVDPSLSLSYQLLPTEHLFVRLMGKRIFRMPTFTELYFYHIGASELKPERATQFNLGLTWEQAEGNFSHALTGDIYINKVTDKILAVPFNMFVWRISNLGEATIVGADITASGTYRASRSHTLSLNANYSWQRAMDTTAEGTSNGRRQLPYTPRHACCATFSWLNPWANLALTTSGQSRRWTTSEHAPGTQMDGFVVVDASLWRTVGIGRRGQRLTLRATLQNIFDRQYDIVAHYPMPGRSWRVQVEVPIW